MNSFFAKSSYYLLLACSFLFPFYIGNSFSQEQRFFFKESTFEKFFYFQAENDSEYAEIIQAQIRKTFPKALSIKVASFITTDNPRDVVTYYANLSGQRFIKSGDHFMYVFSEINERPANRVEIYPAQIPRIAPEHLPTRINLILVSYPISTAARVQPKRTLDQLKDKVGRFFYEGDLREDIAQIEMENLGAGSEVFIIATTDSFIDVYQFFRRRYGPMKVLPAMDGEIYTRDFEIDATYSLPNPDRVLHIRVDENPMITDNKGNSQVYLGYTFIKYIFWPAESNDQ